MGGVREYSSVRVTKLWEDENHEEPSPCPFTLYLCDGRIAGGFGSEIPGVGDFFVGIAVMAHLDAYIGVWVSIVVVSPFVFVEDFYEDFFIVPRRDCDVGVALFVAEEFCIFFGVYISGCFCRSP